MFRLRLWRTDLEKIISKEFAGLAPMHELKITQSESGDTFTLEFDTPALPPSNAGEVQDLSDALFEIAKGGHRP
jgi:hypothetical protein